MCQTSSDKLHLGRIYGVGLDYRSKATVQGAVVLQIQQGFRSHEFPLDFQLDPPVEVNEAILSWDETYFIAESNVRGYGPIKVYLDYVFGEAEEKRSSKAQPFVNNPLSPTLFCRRMIGSIYSGDSTIVTPLCHTHPLRGELELREYGGDKFVSDWDISKGAKCMSVPLLTFIDGFGLYRNSYRSLMGKTLYSLT